MAISDMIAGMVADAIDAAIAVWARRKGRDPVTARRLRRRLEWVVIAIILAVPAVLTFWYW